MQWQKWKKIHLYHTISNTDNSGSNKRNEILPLHQYASVKSLAKHTKSSQRHSSRMNAHMQRTTRCRAPYYSITWETQFEKDESPHSHTKVITTRGPNRGVKRHHQWPERQLAPYLPPTLTLLTLPPRRRTWQLSCTNTSCKDDIVLTRWERLLKATEWPMTTVTATHIKCNDRNENKSIYTTLSPIQTTQVATKGMKYSLYTKK
jgi:hypothetical protein